MTTTKKPLAVFIAAIVSLVCFVGLSAVPYAIPGVGPEKAYAASLKAGKTTDTAKKKTTTTKNLKQRGVKFDLKKNKWKTFNSRINTYNSNTEKIGSVNIKFKAKISNIKIKKAKKKGYKTATFTVTYKSDWIPTKKQREQILNAMVMADGAGIGGMVWTHEVDYTTGIELEGANPYGVTVKCKDGKESYKKFTFGKNCWIRLFRGVKKNFTITYPSSYKGLCIGVGGSSITEFDNHSSWDTDMLYVNKGGAKYTYLTTSYFKKGKSNNHFIRIS